jgi:hypothetical protein
MADYRNTQSDRVGFTPYMKQILDILNMKSAISGEIQQYDQRLRNGSGTNSPLLGSYIQAFFIELEPMLRRWVNPNEGLCPKVLMSGKVIPVTFDILLKMVESRDVAINLEAYRLINTYLDLKGVLKIDKIKGYDPENVFAEDDSL